MPEKKQAILIADLGFGDAGKGTITDFLTGQLAAHTIVRYNGGPQAAHTVVTHDGRSHTFAQFGSGMLHSGTRTLLSRFMLINPLNMLKEERHLRTLGVTDALQRTQIDRRALVITPFQKAINRLREIARGANRHGSCGEGIGECMADHLKYGDAVVFVGDLQDSTTLRKKLSFMHDVKRDEFEEIRYALPDTEQVRQESAVFTSTIDGVGEGKTDGGKPHPYVEDCIDVYRYFADCIDIVDEVDIQSLFAQPGRVLFEGAQGVLLDENYGFAPYTTWSTTTFANADTLVQEHSYDGEVIKLGVVRAYATRHGAGPFPTEDQALSLAIPDQHNTWNDWQQAFRVGYFDMVATRYALDVAGKVDYLAMTNVDRLATIPTWKICDGYQYQGEENDLSTYFELEDDRKIKKIRFSQSVDLSHQENITYKLWSCEPEYQSFTPVSEKSSFEENSAAYLSLITESLSIPIAITSYGPMAMDKRCTQAFRV
jgi:adenylosuccinate synthase